MARGTNLLSHFNLRPDDWKGTEIAKIGHVLSKLSEGETCDPKQVACIATEAQAEEAAALWRQHDLSQHDKGITLVVEGRKHNEEAWKCGEEIITAR